MSITDALMETVQNLSDDKQQEVLDFADFLRTRAANSGPPPTPKIPLPTVPQNGLSALLEQWRQEDAISDKETIRAAQVELDEWKQNMNVNRMAAGERLLFP